MIAALALEPTATLVVGFGVGVVFGFLLQKGGLTKYEVIVNQLRLKDFTLLKIMLTAILVGTVGFYALHEFGLVNSHLRSVVLGGNILGGLIFGVGMALLGYCPGTGVGAFGEGSVHALVGILGMIGGAAAYAEADAWLAKTVLQWGSYGPVALPELLKTNHWMVIALVAAIIVIILLVVKIYELKKSPVTATDVGDLVQ